MIMNLPKAVVVTSMHEQVCGALPKPDWSCFDIGLFTFIVRQRQSLQKAHPPVYNCVYGGRHGNLLKIIMKSIELLANFNLIKIADNEKSKIVEKIFDGARCQIVSVELRNNEMLLKHKANEPITVFCLAGSGTFRAGKDLEDEQKLVAGTLIILEAEMEHEVVAEPEIHILVTKFKRD